MRHRRPLGQHLGERAALDELHRKERPAVGEGAEIVHRHDAGMLQLPGDLRFLDESPHEIRPAGERASNTFTATSRLRAGSWPRRMRAACRRERVRRAIQYARRRRQAIRGLGGAGRQRRLRIGNVADGRLRRRSAMPGSEIASRSISLVSRSVVTWASESRRQGKLDSSKTGGAVANQFEIEIG